MPPDPLRLRRRLALQGGGFALFLLAAFSGSLYWGIANQRQEDQRSELRQLAGSAAAQLPLIAHETREAEGSAKFRAGPQLIDFPALEQQRLQWFDAQGFLLSEQGGLAVGRGTAGNGEVRVAGSAEQAGGDVTNPNSRRKMPPEDAPSALSFKRLFDDETLREARRGEGISPHLRTMMEARLTLLSLPFQRRGLHRC